MGLAISASIERTALAPSPTAAATRFIGLARGGLADRIRAAYYDDRGRSAGLCCHRGGREIDRAALEITPRGEVRSRRDISERSTTSDAAGSAVMKSRKRSGETILTRPELDTRGQVPGVSCDETQLAGDDISWNK